MTKKGKRVLHPGDKVILFLPSYPPCVAWICQEVNTKSIFLDSKGKQDKVKVTRKEQECAEGKGQYMSAAHMQPYSIELWDVCLLWLDMEKKQAARLKILKRGKIPYAD